MPTISHYSIVFDNVWTEKFAVVNFVTLLTKYYIFQQKYLGCKPSIQGLTKEIVFYYLMEKQNVKN